MTSARRFGHAYWLRTGAVCLAAALVVTTSLTVISSVPFVPTLQHALVHSFTMGALAASTLPAVGRRLRGRRVILWWAIVVPVLLVLAVTATWIACALIVVLGLSPSRTLWACFVSDIRITGVMTATIAAGMMLYEMQRSQLAAVTLELRTKELEHERAVSTALEARLSALEARLHPHFLFNTLNAISALIHDDPELAERTVERLAALLRFSLDATKRGTVPLAEELRIVTDYLEIEKARLGDRLAYGIEVGPGVTSCEVPPLAVQTLVENSVKHAIAPRPSGGSIRIEASANGDHVAVAVWDDGPGFADSAVVAGHGLENLQGRLAARFGTRATLSIGRRDGGTLVTLSLPLAASPRVVTA